MLSKKSLDILAPIYNEEDCIPELIKRLDVLRSSLNNYEINYIFTNDGSTDSSLSILKKLAAIKSYIKVIDLSRNFGHQIALSAALEHSNADFVAMIDADLQDPPEVIKDMLLKCEEGFDTVYAQRLNRVGETKFKLATAKIFYKILSHLCDVEIPPDTGDFRVINKKVLDSFCSMKEKHRFIRGMIPWCGYKSFAFQYQRQARFAGATKYPFKKMLKFALDAIFSFSDAPLRIMRWLGTFITLSGFVGGLCVLYLKIFTNTILPGFTVILLSVIILGGVQILSLAVIGDYVGRIFEESKRRPLYFINEKINL